MSTPEGFNLFGLVPTYLVGSSYDAEPQLFLPFFKRISLMERWGVNEWQLARCIGTSGMGKAAKGRPQLGVVERRLDCPGQAKLGI